MSWRDILPAIPSGRDPLPPRIRTGTDGMKRRDFIALLGSATVVWPRVAGAQQATIPVVGFLNGASPSEMAFVVTAFRRGLNSAGYVEGQNVKIEYRWGDGQYERMPELAADLIRRQVTVIAAMGAPAAVPAKAATATIPIVFFMGEDPVQLGLVASFNRPGGNVTGMAYLSSALVAKRLEVLHELVPRASVVAALVNPKNPNAELSAKDAQEAARILGKQVHILTASTATEIEAVFAMLAQLQVGALFIAPDAFFNSQIDQLVALTVRYAIPASYNIREFTAAGGLMSYGARIADGWREAGIYVGRVLKGEKPSELPVMQPTKFELVINMMAAKALGLAVPLTLQVAADELIE
jgi:putative ABC transport system substrate-binding protein